MVALGLFESAREGSARGVADGRLCSSIKLIARVAMPAALELSPIAHVTRSAADGCQKLLIRAREQLTRS
eukprot:5684238-Pyramimonas_sp.AAC.1